VISTAAAQVAAQRPRAPPESGIPVPRPRNGKRFAPISLDTKPRPLDEADSAALFASGKDAPVRIRIATLNVWGLPFTPDDAERIRAIGERLDSLAVDVMAFQEVWTADFRRTLIAAGRGAGLSEVWHNDAAFGGSGLLVLSRLPIRDVKFEQFSLRGQPERITQGDYYGGKGFARIRLDTADGPITLVNTHLHARYGRRVAHEYRALRAAQIVELAIRARETEDPIVATGDFNFEEDEVGYGVLVGLTGFRDTAVEIDRRQPTVHRGNTYRSTSRKADKRIDYVFVRDGRHVGVRTRWVERVFDEPFVVDGRPASYSNHAGVLSEIEIVPGSAGSRHQPDRRAVELAGSLLTEGRSEAIRRQRSGRTLAGVGLGGAAVALGALRTPPLTRRRLLRRGLQAAGLLALTPALGYSILSEYFVPDELEGFDAIAQRLSEFDRRRGDGAIA
jgi:endonuclease/exonuclease/phosphatase family metal-dependent hydrolase